ncbi:methyltransferase [Undibacterium sp. JH2W]|uniref:methyltransferase n=1 Tax=Undibacterium sp. JH2W TaxID=3413037 RepID=UPI003BF0E597
MHFETPHALQAYWDLAAASVQADALDLALELGIFEALTQPCDLADLTTQLDLHASNTANFLDLLWSMGLLQRCETKAQGKHVMSYQSRPEALHYLSKDSPDYCGDAWLYRLRALRHFGTQLREHVKHGKSGSASAFASAIGKNWAAAAKAQIGQEQRAVTVAAALAIIHRIPEFKDARNCLDLGGGPGWVAIALAQANPALRASVFDWPETALVAQDNIEQAGLSGRVQAQGGDLAVDDIGEAYDFIWCSSVLHFVPDVNACLQKIYAALRPGGVLVCAHAEIAPNAQTAARVLPYYLPMMMQGKHVGKQGGLATELRQVGFCSIGGFEACDFPMAPVQVLIAKKAVS